MVIQTSDSFCLSLRLAIKDVSSGIDSGALVFFNFNGFCKFPSSFWLSVDGSGF